MNSAAHLTYSGCSLEEVERLLFRTEHGFPDTESEGGLGTVPDPGRQEYAHAWPAQQADIGERVSFDRYLPVSSQGGHFGAVTHGDQDPEQQSAQLDDLSARFTTAAAFTATTLLDPQYSRVGERYDTRPRPFAEGPSFLAQSEAVQSGAGDLNEGRPSFQASSHPDVTGITHGHEVSDIEIHPAGTRARLELELLRTREMLEEGKKAVDDLTERHNEMSKTLTNLDIGLQSMTDLALFLICQRDMLEVASMETGERAARAMQLWSARLTLSEHLEKAILCVSDGSLVLDNRFDSVLKHVDDLVVRDREIPMNRRPWVKSQ